MHYFSDEFYVNIILRQYPDCLYIRQPDITGQVGKVFFVVLPTDTIVCKFNDQEIIQRNYQISQILKNRIASIPVTKTHEFSNVYFETYKYCPGKTLFEYIQQGMSADKIFDIYQQAIFVQKEISKINPKELNFKNCKYAHETFAYNVKTRTSNIVTTTKSFIYKVLSNNNQQLLLHNDIQPRNILINGDMQLTGLIDLDSIALCNESFSVLRTLDAYPLKNYTEYIDFYEDTMQRKVNRRAILYGMNLLNQIRSCKQAIFGK